MKKKSKDRIEALDVTRGIALSGILVLNIQFYAVPVELMDTIDQKFESAGPLGELLGLLSGLLEKKMMGLFSMLFGMSAVLVMESAERSGVPAWRVYFRRMLSLLTIGAIHTGIWWGDILIVYAICGQPLFFLRRLPPSLLLVVGVAIYSALAPALGLVWQGMAEPYSEADVIARAFGMMLVGMTLFRWGFFGADKTVGRNVALAVIGLVVGGALQISFAAEESAGFRSQALNNLGALIMSLGFLGATAFFAGMARFEGTRKALAAVGRMAFTHYLMHTVVGFVFSTGNLSPDWQMVVLAATLAVQLAVSQPWLRRFQYGPMEWLWRCVTHWKWQPLFAQKKKRA